MKYEFIDYPEYFIFDDWYNKQELRVIWEDLDDVYYNNKLLNNNETSGAIRNGKFLVNCKRSHILPSRITDISKQCFPHLSWMFSKIARESWFWSNVMHNVCNDDIMLSYYENEDYYDSHTDGAEVTMLTWFFKEPKKFTGGDLTLTDFNQTIECRNNRLVVIPSCLKHEVSPIHMKEEDRNQHYGRYCLTNFLIK